MLLMSLSLLLQLCPASFGWFMRWETGGHSTAVLQSVASRVCSRQHVAFLCSSHWTYSLCILFVSMWWHPYSCIDIAIIWKKSRFVLLARSDLHIITNFSITFYTFTRHMLTPLSVDKMWLPRYVNKSAKFRGLSLRVKMAPSCLKHVNLHSHSHWSSVYSVSLIVSFGNHLLKRQKRKK